MRSSWDWKCFSFFFAGAIRFGDVLSFDDCEDIMNELSKCDLPFQCAHGRYFFKNVLKALVKLN